MMVDIQVQLPPKDILRWAGDYPKRRFSVGDCIIFAEYINTTAKMVAVVVGISLDGYYAVSYLNESFALGSTREMRLTLYNAHLITDFGVALFESGDEYFCVRYRDSSVTHSDGSPRHWAENTEKRYKYREEVMDVVHKSRQFSIGTHKR